jgi:hypothetical protein
MVRLPSVDSKDIFVNPDHVSAITGADDLDCCTIYFGNGPKADHMDIDLSKDEVARRLRG